MKLWTAQMAKHRKAKELGLNFVDTTVKTGNPIFAPTWGMVFDWKAGTLPWSEYRKAYLDMMRISWVNNRNQWEDLLHQDNAVIACYCPSNCKPECHRFILQEVFCKVCEWENIEYQYMGEL